MLFRGQFLASEQTDHLALPLLCNRPHLSPAPWQKELEQICQLTDQPARRPRSVRTTPVATHRTGHDQPEAVIIIYRPSDGPGCISKRVRYSRMRLLPARPRSRADRKRSSGGRSPAGHSVSSGGPAWTQAWVPPVKASSARHAASAGSSARRQLRQCTVGRGQHDRPPCGSFANPLRSRDRIANQEPGIWPCAWRRLSSRSIATDAVGGQSVAQVRRNDARHGDALEAEARGRAARWSTRRPQDRRPAPQRRASPSASSRCRHHRAHAVVVHQHDARAPGRDMRVGFLHQLAAGRDPRAGDMPGPYSSGVRTSST